MDFFLAICQALGIALAIGALAGAAGPQGGTSALLEWVAAALGAAAGALSMSIDDQSIIGGIVVGAVGGWLAARVISSIVFGAAQRAEGGGFGTVGLIVSVAALVLAGLSILLPPVSLVALLALAWLAIARRRRSQRKYEGLRSLR
jgi:hypothetical protein